MKRNFLLCCSFLLTSTFCARALPTAAEALDGPSLVWSKLGNNFQIATSTNFVETHDKVDSFITGGTVNNITDGQKSGVQTRVVGPGTLTFWWRVSSELGFDAFGFWIGPSIATGGVHTQQDPEVSISGPTYPWELQTFVIPPGTNYLEWVYIKDESDSDGTDKGYLDEVFFIPDPPTITNQPATDVTISPAGTNVTFSVGFMEGGFPAVAKQTKISWQLNGTNLVGRTNATLTLTNVQVSQSGEYRVVITNLYGSTISDPAVLQVFQPYPLDNSLDTTNLVWTTSGDVQWFGLLDPAQSHDGSDVARSGVTPDDFDQLSLSSYLQTTVTGPGVLKFWWRLSGLDTDQFYMSIGGVLKTNAPSEDGDWTEETIGVPTGVKIVKFTYLRDDFISTDDTDGAYLDQFRFIPSTNAPPTFSLPMISPENGFSTTIRLDPSRSYTIQRSTNLISWTNVITFTNDDVFYEFLDPSVTNATLNRFYRIKSP